jgi:PPOX class probable F420-dependent enzyme
VSARAKRDRRPRALTDELREFVTSGNFATFSTLLPDGGPAAQVMWIDCDADCLLINTEVHRQKFKSIEADPRVSVCIWQRDDPYDYVEVRGEVIETIRGERARAHIDQLAWRYFGRPYDETIITSERVILRIRIA